MTQVGRTLSAALIGMMSATALTGTANASAFVAWQVTDVSPDDVLMVRAYPSSSSRILVGYPDGVVLSMTGRCTGGVRIDDIQGRPSDEQRELVRGSWCEVWFDPYGSGEFRNGWVFGRYIAPN